MKKHKSVWRRIFDVALAVLLSLLLILTVVASYFLVCGYQMYRDVIDTTDIKAVVDEIRAKETYTKLDELPELYINGVIAVEDQRFYSHSGIDIISIFRAIVINIKEMEFEAGGSTITQQIAKNLFFTNEKKIERKVAEVFMVRRLEELYTKDELIELYVNLIDFGSGYFGIYEASVGYYAKEPHELDEIECAMLIGVPNAPNCYSPRENPEEAAGRCRYVMEQLVESGLLDEEFLQVSVFPEVAG